MLLSGKLNTIPNILFRADSLFTSTPLSRNPDSGEGDSQKREFYNVFIHDPNLINYAKENLKRKDRVFVNGFLNYKSELDQDGKKQVNGYVEATNIFKIDRFSELSSENPVDDRIKSANE